MMSALGSRLLPIWLGLLLLLMQQLGLQHGLTHGLHSGTGHSSMASLAMPVAAATASESDPDEAGHAVCGLCLAHAAIGFALWPTVLRWTASLAKLARPLVRVGAGRATPRLAHRARAPPTLQR